MRRERQRPQREQIDTSFGEYTERHPAYALIGASRITRMGGGGGGGQVLFGSDFRHDGFVRIAIRKAHLTRDISHDYIHGSGRGTLIEVDLSEAQWATFVSTMNVGEGVPCTLESLDNKDIPEIVPDTDRRDQLRGEIDDTMQDAIKAIEAVRDAAPNKKLRDLAETALRELNANLPYVAKSYDEHAEVTVERAKMEVAAYVARQIQRAGLKALGADEPLLELIEGEAQHD